MKPPLPLLFTTRYFCNERKPVSPVSILYCVKVWVADYSNSLFVFLSRSLSISLSHSLSLTHSLTHSLSLNLYSINLTPVFSFELYYRIIFSNHSVVVFCIGIFHVTATDNTEHTLFSNHEWTLIMLHVYFTNQLSHIYISFPWY